MRSSKRLLVLFSGGDAPGMNPCLRGIVRLAVNRHELQVLVSRDGFNGLVAACAARESGHPANRVAPVGLLAHAGCATDALPGIFTIGPADVRGLAGMGGILVGAGRCPEFLDVFVRKQVVSLLIEELGIDTVVIVGGNGSLKAGETLAAESNLQVLVIPATIDNDVAASEATLGFDTAINTVMHAIEHFSDTAWSHHRVMVLEIMGRTCGDLTRKAGLAAGVEILVTPERGPVTADKLIGISERLLKGFRQGRRHGIVLVTEGAAVEREPDLSAQSLLVQYLNDFFRSEGREFRHTEVRASVLGHLQRGGRPTAADRILAVEFAAAAVSAVHDTPQLSGVIAVRHGRIKLVPFDEPHTPNDRENRAEKLYALQKDISRSEPHRAQTSASFADDQVSSVTTSSPLMWQ